MHISKFTAHALEDVKNLPKNVRNALKKEFQTKIHVNPTNCSEALTGLLTGFRSFHFGNFRVVCKIYDDLKAVAVVGVGKKDRDHQTNLYRKLEELAKTGKLADAVLATMRLLDPE